MERAVAGCSGEKPENCTKNHVGSCKLKQGRDFTETCCGEPTLILWRDGGEVGERSRGLQ